METKKIAIACFIGGALCCSVALLVAPMFWWLGLIAGFAGGYLSYEFRSVLAAIPDAWNDAKWKSHRFGQAWANLFCHYLPRALGRLWHSVQAWFAKPHPIFYPTFALGILMGCVLEYIAVKAEFPWFIHLILLWFFCAAGLVPSIIFFMTMAFIGSRVEKCSWWPLMDSLRSPEEDRAWLESKGLELKPITYANFLRWVAKGFSASIFFFVWSLWRSLAVDVIKPFGYLCGTFAKFVFIFFVWSLWRSLAVDVIKPFGCLCGAFAKFVFIRIHSSERLLCGIDGTIGGALSYLMLSGSAETSSDKLLVVICGGLLGAMLGVLNWEIVSKRLLHVTAEK